VVLSRFVLAMTRAIFDCLAVSENEEKDGVRVGEMTFRANKNFIAPEARKTWKDSIK